MQRVEVDRHAPLVALVVVLRSSTAAEREDRASAHCAKFGCSLVLVERGVERDRAALHRVVLLRLRERVARAELRQLDAGGEVGRSLVRSG